MSDFISLDLRYTEKFVANHELAYLKPYITLAAKQLTSGEGAGSEFTGWLNLPKDYDKKEFTRIVDAAKKIRRQSKVLIVIGIGGSYLGAKAAIEFLGHSFHNNIAKNKRNTPEIYFAGTNISSKYLNDLIEVIGNRDFSVNVISKSGTTTEPAIAFRVFKKILEERYGKAGAKERIFATTDTAKGALKSLADKEGYESFVVPDNVGGRFSVLTAVGLLPIACAGVDIRKLMIGAQAAMKECNNPFEENACYQYVAVRNALLRKGKDIEMLVSYEPRLLYIAEWWKQLFGESEGKDQKGLFTASANFTTDLHSLGQYIQDGRRHLFETLIEIKEDESPCFIPFEDSDNDGLNYLSGKSLDFVNKKAAQGTLLAHQDGGVPNVVIRLAKADAAHLGYLFYFFEKACAISGYLLGVNPFDQPGVEAYKLNMFALLGKKGYESLTEELNKKI
ncbi:MAG: glucose-6-phosphate isomerase [Saprospiraceae bacterium]|nr:glucose-6-phosphate isomerase [Saprospiraceae bacterium]